MARKRMIDPNFWTDEKLGQCSISERLLFMGLISNADDEGYGRANPKLLKSLVFPYDDLRASDLEKWLSRLGGLNLIALYEESGQTYYYLPNFSKHQTINKPTSSTFPKPNDGATVALWEDYGSTTVALPPKRREEKRREEHPLPPQGDCQSESLAIEMVAVAEQSANHSKTSDFDLLWQAYPKKVGKGAAEKAFAKIKQSHKLLGVMLSAIAQQAKSEQWRKDGGQFIPNPSTWLNQKRWEDSVAEQLPTSKADDSTSQLSRYPKLGEW